MIVIVMLCILFLTLLFQPTRERYLVAKIFILVNIIHEVVFYSAGGLTYYLTAALFNLLSMLLISRIKPVSDTAMSLLIICFISIITNMVGWAIWYKYYPPGAYDAAYMMIYVWAIYTLMRGTKADVGTHTNILGSQFFRRLLGARLGNTK